jgi:hypothetical protein
MDCRDVTAQAIDQLAGEAGEAMRRDLSAHLAGCENCRREIARLEDVWTTLGMDPDAEVTPDFRRRTLGLLEEQMIRDRVREFRPRHRVVRPLLQAAALLGAASLGYILSRGLAPAPSPNAAASLPAPASALLPDLASKPRFSNVSYRAADKDGKVGIGFDVTSRHELDGRPSDPEVARLLAYLVSHNAETAGERSQAIELVSEHYGANNAPASPEIVAALSATLRKDSNPGVRKKAADALASFPMTPEIRTVFLESLRGDKNPAVRLVAVDALAAAAKLSPDASTIQSLREKAVDPQENGFVRAKAASALKSISF